MQAVATDPVRLDIAHHFAEVPDPRHPAFCEYHLLGDILVIALSAVLSGARSWDGIAAFGVDKRGWLGSLGLTLPHGIPSHDTFRRVFSALDPVAFQGAFTSWVNAVCHGLGFCHVPIDGKTVRGSRGPDGTCLQLVSAWEAGRRLSLAQVAVADKGNEITAIPALLSVLHLQGALVSIDAIGCQKDIARQIHDGGGDYLLAVKDNQPTLAADVLDCFLEAYEADFEGIAHQTLTTREVGHGRLEERTYTVLYDPAGLSTAGDWAGLKSVVQVLRTRCQGDQESCEAAYYISSSRAGIDVLAEGIRSHWAIENGQHWCLDVLFGEDRCRSRHGHAAENLAWLRKVALSLFGQDQTKGSIPTRQFRAALNDDYRTQLLNLLC